MQLRRRFTARLSCEEALWFPSMTTLMTYTNIRPYISPLSLRLMFARHTYFKKTMDIFKPNHHQRLMFTHNILPSIPSHPQSNFTTDRQAEQALTFVHFDLSSIPHLVRTGCLQLLLSLHAHTSTTKAQTRTAISGVTRPAGHGNAGICWLHTTSLGYASACLMSFFIVYHHHFRFFSIIILDYPLFSCDGLHIGLGNSRLFSFFLTALMNDTTICTGEGMLGLCSGPLRFGWKRKR